MHKSKRPLKTMVFSLGLAAMTLTANNLSAQNGGGLFGRGEAEAGNRSNESYTLNNQKFGASTDGFEITNEEFGAPIGGGLGILIAAGLGFAAAKKRKGCKGQRNKTM